MSVGSENDIGKVSNRKRQSRAYCELNFSFGVLFMLRIWPPLRLLTTALKPKRFVGNLSLWVSAATCRSAVIFALDAPHEGSVMPIASVEFDQVLEDQLTPALSARLHQQSAFRKPAELDRREA